MRFLSKEILMAYIIMSCDLPEKNSPKKDNEITK
jgi:hypothetical protein